MKKIFYEANSRGFADHSWLKTYHTFSFANYYDVKRMNFGTLRVMNDDEIAGGMGFGAHPHRNMEIITIPLEGALKHGDNMGNEGIIERGDIQVMSAGTGVIHSERNPNQSQRATLLQIWVFPNKENVNPRYDQMNIFKQLQPNELLQILSPNPDDAGVWIHQEAWFSYGKFDRNFKENYSLKREENGVFIFVIEGAVKVGDQILNRRDAMGIWESKEITIEAIDDSEFLLMDIPMELPNFATR